PDPLSTRTPTVLPSPPAPDASVPTRLPATMLPSPERRIPTSNLVTSRPSTWLPSTVTFRPVIFFPVWLSSLTSGDPANPGWLLPSITTGSVTAGNAALVTPIVSTPPPAIANRILSVPANAFASVIACRSDPGPASAVVDTTNVAADACGTTGVADTDTPAAASRLAPAALHRPAPRFTLITSSSCAHRTQKRVRPESSRIAARAPSVRPPTDAAGNYRAVSRSARRRIRCSAG